MPAPSPPIALGALAGNWTAQDNAGAVVFELSIDSSNGTDVVKIANPGDKSSCWTTGAGGWDKETNAITNLVTEGCDRQATGVVKKRTVTKVIDHDYVYAGEVLDLTWAVRNGPVEYDGSSKGHWPTWTKVMKDYEVVLESH